MADTLGIINSIFSFTDTARSIYASDIAKKDVDGKRASNIAVTTTSSGAIEINTVFAKVNNMLQRNIRSFSAIASYNDTITTTLQKFDSVVGNKSDQLNLIARLGQLSDASEALQKNPSQINKINFVRTLQNTVLHINDLARGGLEVQSTADNNLAIEVSDFNTLINQIAEQNTAVYELKALTHTPLNAQRIKDAIDDRDKLISDLSKKANLVVETGENSMLNIKVGDFYVVYGQQTFPLSFASAMPGQPYNPVTYLGQNALTGLNSGTIRANLDLRDILVPVELAKLDNLTGNLVDLINQAANRGTAQNIPTSLTGTIGVPGFNAPLIGTTTIAGQGIVRIAAINQNTKVMGANYVDIDLSTINTMQGLVDAINNANKGVQASLTPAGQLQIQSSINGSGVGVSYNGALMPKINYGAAFNAPSAWEFSHFFGLNNLVSAGSRLPGESSAGVSSVISLNPTVLTNPQGLTCDALTTDPAPPINAIVLPDHDGSVMGSIYTALNKTNVTFAAAGNFSQKSDTVRQYSELMFDSFIKKSTQFRTDTKRYSDILQDLGKQQFTESGINPKERLMAIQTVNDLQAVGSKLFKLYMESRRMLMELM